MGFHGSDCVTSATTCRQGEHDRCLAANPAPGVVVVAVITMSTNTVVSLPHHLLWWSFSCFDGSWLARAEQFFTVYHPPMLRKFVLMVFDDILVYNL